MFFEDCCNGGAVGRRCRRLQYYLLSRVVEVVYETAGDGVCEWEAGDSRFDNGNGIMIIVVIVVLL